MCLKSARPALAAPAEADLLLTFKAGIENWDEVAADRRWNGWDCATGADCTPVCSWGGVTCNPYHVHEGNFVNELRLGCNGCRVKMRGQLRPGIQRLQHLELLYLDNNEVRWAGWLLAGGGEQGGAAARGGASSALGARGSRGLWCVLRLGNHFLNPLLMEAGGVGSGPAQAPRMVGAGRLVATRRCSHSPAPLASQPASAALPGHLARRSCTALCHPSGASPAASPSCWS